MAANEESVPPMIEKVNGSFDQDMLMSMSNGVDNCQPSVCFPAEVGQSENPVEFINHQNSKTDAEKIAAEKIQFSEKTQSDNSAERPTNQNCQTTGSFFLSEDNRMEHKAEDEPPDDLSHCQTPQTGFEEVVETGQNSAPLEKETGKENGEEEAPGELPSLSELSPRSLSDSAAGPPDLSPENPARNDKVAADDGSLSEADEKLEIRKVLEELICSVVEESEGETNENVDGAEGKTEDQEVLKLFSQDLDSPDEMDSSKEKDGEESEVEFLDEVPKQVQNRLENTATSTAATAVTGETLKKRFLNLVVKDLKSQKDGKLMQQKISDLLSRFVQQESVLSPLGVRKIVESGEFRVPTSVTMPPSQVVDLLAEYEPEKELKSLIGEIFGADAPSPDSLAERKHKQEFRFSYPAPNFTRVLYDIGLQLAQESTYSDIVSMKNLPSEMPKKPDTISKVVAQVKPFLEMLKTQTGPYKLEQNRCCRCPFRTESELVMYGHKLMPHYRERVGLFYCGFCPKWFSTNRQMVIAHYEQEHQCKPLFERPPAKAPCTYCNEEFVYKGNLQQHLRICKRHWKHKNILALTEDDRLTANKWLWEKPAYLPGAGMSTGVRVMQLPQQNTAVQLVTGGANAGPRMIRLPGQGRPAPVQPMLRYPMGLPQQQYRRHPNILPKNVIQPPAMLPRMPLSNLTTMNTSLDMQQYRQKLLQQQLNLQTRNRPVPTGQNCEICDSFLQSRDKYFDHLQNFHKKLAKKTRSDFWGGAPLACSRCRERFWTYEGLERHLVMIHGLVTSDLLQKAQNKLDCGRCLYCNKQYAFNLLQHLVMDHKKKLCSAEILYSCDVCSYQCTSYSNLERHLNEEHGSAKTITQAKKSIPQKRLLGLPTSQPPAKAARLDPKAQTASKQKKTGKIRYTCTPCALKFVAYSEVIQHWQDKHLAKIKIPTCRVDQCAACKEKFQKQEGVNFDFELSGDNSSDTATAESDIICLD